LVRLWAEKVAMSPMAVVKVKLKSVFIGFSFWLPWNSSKALSLNGQKLVLNGVGKEERIV
jgi:hypothetical protein